MVLSYSKAHLQKLLVADYNKFKQSIENLNLNLQIHAAQKYK